MIFVIWHSFLVVWILNLNVKVLVAFDQEMAIICDCETSNFVKVRFQLYSTAAAENGECKH